MEGPFTNLTYDDHFMSHVEMNITHLVKKKSCVMSSVALEEIYHAGENNQNVQQSQDLVRFPGPPVHVPMSLEKTLYTDCILCF